MPQPPSPSEFPSPPDSPSPPGSPGASARRDLLDPRAFDERLVVCHEPESVQSEQYRAFRTNLLAMPGGDASRVMLFGSAFPEEGKTITVANVALCLAEMTEARVCLIDGDMRVPSLGEMFNVSDAPGLTDVLLDRVGPERVIRSSHLPNLSLITAGRPADNVPEATSSEYMVPLVSYLKQRYDYVLIDSPPCLVFADAMDMGKVADGVVLVIAVGKTSRKDVESAIERIQRGGAKILGSFVTGGFVFRSEPLYTGEPLW